MNSNEKVSWEIILEKIGEPESFSEGEELILIMVLTLNMPQGPLTYSLMRQEEQQCIFDESVED